VAEILSLCTCSAVHRELYRFDNAIAGRGSQWGKAAGRALRCFALRGQSAFIHQVRKKLGYGLPEDMSCQKFLYRAFKSLDRARTIASEIDNFWGAYYVVKIDLLIAAKDKNIELPDDIPKDRTVPLLGAKDDINALCNIIDGLNQIVSATDRNYDGLKETRTTLGENIIETVFKVFEKEISKVQNWYEDKKLLNTTINLVHLWGNLGRTYLFELKKLEELRNKEKEKYDETKANEIRSTCQQDVQNLIECVETILDKMGSAEAVRDEYVVIKNLFETGRFELDDSKELLEVVKGKPGEHF